jgi:hypothetical protein
MPREIYTSAPGNHVAPRSVPETMSTVSWA